MTRIEKKLVILLKEKDDLDAELVQNSVLGEEVRSRSSQ